jgi:hypothetical protein
MDVYEASVRTVRDALAGDEDAASAFEGILELHSHDRIRAAAFARCSQKNCGLRVIEVRCSRGHTSPRK